MPPENSWRIFLVFLRLGLTSFGGPVAHLGYFRDEFVTRRRWLSEHSYADLVALRQFLPGPASSQVGMALSQLRHGYRGSLAAWAGSTLPSALILIADKGAVGASTLLSMPPLVRTSFREHNWTVTTGNSWPVSPESVVRLASSLPCLATVFCPRSCRVFIQSLAPLSSPLSWSVFCLVWSRHSYRSPY